MQRFENREIDAIIKFLEDAEAGKPITELKLPPTWDKFYKKNLPRKNYDNDDAWLKALITAATMLREKLFRERGKLTQERVVDQFCDENIIAGELVLEERIDAN